MSQLQTASHMKMRKLTTSIFYEGILSCPCGYHATIENGIVGGRKIYMKEVMTGLISAPETIPHDIGEDWEIYVQKCSDAIIERIDRGDWNGKVIMEANVNGFFFTYNNIHQLPRELYLYYR